MKAATPGTVILLAAATFAAGCTAAPQRKAVHQRAARQTESAITLAEQRVHCSSQWRQASEPLPATFRASSAVLCDLTIKLTQGSGPAVITESVADHGLAPLVAALRRPSARPSPGTICPAQLVVVAPLFLINADGLLIRPVIPTDACGAPQPQVLDALQHVPWVTVHVPAHANRMPAPARRTDAQTVRKPGYRTKLAEATYLTCDLRRRTGRGYWRLPGRRSHSDALGPLVSDSAQASTLDINGGEQRRIRRTPGTRTDAR
jgi:hypothetical protein